MVSKKQALSHTGFLPRWTAQSDPRPASAKRSKDSERRLVGEVRLDLGRYSLSVQVVHLLLKGTKIATSIDCPFQSKCLLSAHTQTPPKQPSAVPASRSYLYCVHHCHHLSESHGALLFTVPQCLLLALVFLDKNQAAVTVPIITLVITLSVTL